MNPPAAAVGDARRALPADAGVAAALGALQTLAYVHTSLWPLQLACIAALVHLAARRRPTGAALLGLAFGSAWLAAGTWWLYVSLHDYGGLPAVLAVLSVAVLSLGLALYLAAALGLWARGRCGVWWRDALLFGACWLLAELCRGVVFTGFPWIASGYAHVDGPLAGFAPWIGVYGMGAIAAMIAAAAALLERRSLRGPALAVVLTLALGVLAGQARFSEPTGTLRVTLLQGNVPQNEKFAAEHLPDTLEWTRGQLLDAKGDLVVGPETVIPLLPDQLDPDWWNPIVEHFRRGTQAALVGIPLGDAEAGYTNSAVGLSADSARLPGGLYRYDKHHLVPFGEFVPNGFHWFVRMMNIPLGDFNRGPLAAPSFEVRGERVAPNICYEDLFGEELATRFVDEARAPTLFANLSNIAWFGRTVAIDQHLQISRLRALEFERPMVRATNTGATAVIDHRGVVTAALAPHTQGTLDGIVQGRRGVTPYARWAGAWGLWPAWLAGALLAIATFRRPHAGGRATPLP
ncbi:MAG TPA: apolipoprotein N-acyltransferase [Caldimonas sp.]|nr:apolipoprotein N-acyltransferase [Caldimonas sp.]